MTELTRDQIEALRAEWQAEADKKGKEPEAHLQYCRNMVAAFDLALEALEMRPRPLAEIDKAETALVIERDQHSQGLNVFVLNCYGSGHWKRSTASQAWLPSTLAIPLSSIAKVTP